MMKKVNCSKKTWICVLAAEVLFLIIAGFFLHGHKGAEISFSQEELFDNADEERFYLDRSSDARYVATPEFTLPRGMYTLTVQYEGAGDAAARVVHPGGKYQSEVSGDIPLAGRSTASCDFRVRYANRPLQMRVAFSDDAGEGDYILLRGVSITNASCFVRNGMFRLTLFFVAVNGILYFICKKRSGGQIFHTDFEDVPWRALVLLIAFCSIPLMVDYLFLNSHDLYFHLMRIEGLRAGLESGMFPVRIQPGWLSGHGYASSVFYGDFFLYFPAFLRWFGVSVQTAYKCYVVLIHVLTVCISYYSFAKMSQPKTGLFCAALYSLNIYRLTCIYTRAAVGEYTAMAFMPLVLYGLWKLYTLPEETKAHKESWLPVTAGCTGIFLSHMISTQIAALFIILSAVFCWKRVFRKKTLLVIGKAAAATVLLNAWFLVPFLDYMTSAVYVINNADTYSSYRIEQTGTNLAQFFMNDYDVFAYSQDIPMGSAGEMPLTVGMALMAVLGGWFLLCFLKKRSNEERKTELLAVFFCLLSLFMTTCYFPYTQLANRLPVLRLSVASIQYLWRFFSVSALVLVWLFCLILQKEWITVNRRKWFAGALVCLSLWQGWSYMSQCVQNGEVYRIYQTGNMSTMEAQGAFVEKHASVMGGEYLPVSGDGDFTTAEAYVEAYTESLTYDEECISVESWSRERDGAVVAVLENRTDELQQLELPLLLYKGYRVTTEKGDTLSITPGTSYRLSAAVPAGFSGSIRAAFYEPWYWRLCELVSLAAFAGIVFGRMKRKAQVYEFLHFLVDSK